jgi:hypothetical protein
MALTRFLTSYGTLTDRKAVSSTEMLLCACAQLHILRPIFKVVVVRSRGRRGR